MGGRARNAAILSVGTIVGQLAAVIALPLLTRIYSPEEIGLATVFTSIVALLSVTASLHYELAIPLPRRESVAKVLSVVSIGIAILTSVALMLIAAEAGEPIFDLLGASGLEPFKFWIPASLLLTAIGTVLSFVAVRHQRHTGNALSKVLQGWVQSGTQCVAGFVGAGLSGLILGQIVGLVASIIPIVPLAWIKERCRPFSCSVRSIGSLMRRYKDFAIAASPSSLVNAIAVNVPALALASAFGVLPAAFYGLSLRVVQLPMRMVTRSVSQVFFGDVARAASPEALRTAASRVFTVVLEFCLHSCIALAIVSPILFSYVFGREWEEAGLYTRLLIPWLIVNAISTPLSMIVTLKQKQRQELSFQIGYLLVILAVLGASALLGEALTAVLALGVAGFVYTTFRIWWLLGLADTDRYSLLGSAWFRILKVVLMYIPLAIAVAFDAPELVVLASTAIVVSLLHINNYRRGIYAF